MVQRDDNATNNCSPKQRSPYNGLKDEDEDDLELDVDDEEQQQLNDVKEYDPQIRLHLEELNKFATKINQLEKCVEVSDYLENLPVFLFSLFTLFSCRKKTPNSKRSSTRAQFSCTSLRKRLAKRSSPRRGLTTMPLASSRGKVLRILSYQSFSNSNLFFYSLQIKCQIAAIKFEKYNELHREAKQAIADTELMFHKEMRDDEDGNFDHIWQEKLNQANTKVRLDFVLEVFILIIFLISS